MRMSAGRPTLFTEEVADRICELVATTSMSIKSICDEEGMPSVTTLFRWLADDKYTTFREQYACAREAKADFLADELLDIVDDGSNDLMTITKGDASYEMENKEVTSRSKLRFEARRWLMSKMQPKKYGDKLDVTSNGKELSTMAVTIVPPKEDD